METQRKTYHHGSLRQALVDAALAIAKEDGVDQVTVREAGKRAGVSSGAPFRHFPTKTALMTAVAEEAMRRFRAEISVELDRTEKVDPLARFRALGIAYLRWVINNPTHFEIISMRRALDFDASETLVQLNEEIRGMMVQILEDARAAGQLRTMDMEGVPLQARALVYGLARMWIDGQFAQWGGAEKAELLMRQSLDNFLALLAK
ncbi:TetR/AcrR family transcriptional regulator [Mesorhizobium sp. CO1-1-8]|uniref:TetR/AcrR family transcriptional regulator n=1 Tax=Mesorhizobium sp. CO1-1-8 TaxID=2876631 RepID=UPI001CD0F742|nr:TetR/AcrR family transcriptional regulator [Mesorhizobium sp. CO1-1-8]MBZ9775903.1 TetR/AcrR family transcriptional regulator [Mesorhizobium sp. CO1-1-8]